MKRKVKIIGLTGGAGSGKTEAAHFFSELGFEVKLNSPVTTGKLKL